MLLAHIEPGGATTYTMDVNPVIVSKRRIPANQTKPGWGMMKRGQRPCSASLSVVTAGCPTMDQLIPQAQHLPR